MKPVVVIFVLLYLLQSPFKLPAQQAWYTQGNFVPPQRIAVSLANTLPLHRKDVPVTITRNQFPLADFHDFYITLVDSAGEPKPEPDMQQIGNFGVHEIRGEQHGRMIFHQLDDLDKDGIWDGLFFIPDIKAGASKTIYCCMGYNNRGWNPYTTAAAMGSYARHVVPFWENEFVGWKLWYPADIDVYGKRKPQLITAKLSQENLDGYGVPYDMGSDIMAVGTSQGGGGIMVFDQPTYPDSVSRPRFTPARVKAGLKSPFNTGPLSDTRFAFDIVVNGPLRCTVKIKTFNWHSGNGYFELEQLYMAYTRQHHSTCKVRFTRCKPIQKEIWFGCGIKKHSNQATFYQQKNIVVTGGPEDIVNPEDSAGHKKLAVAFISTACVVKNEFKPRFTIIKSATTNKYAFKIKPSKSKSFEYMIAAAWSEGGRFTTNAAFQDYMIQAALEYENPLSANIGIVQTNNQLCEKTYI